MSKIVWVTLIISVLVASCKTEEIVTKPYVKLKESTASQLSYYLPKNAYHVQIKVVRKQEFKGPFSDYADDYLGLKEPVIRLNKTTYSLAETKLNLLTFTDGGEQYFIHLDGTKNVPLQLTPLGTLAGINSNINTNIVIPEMNNDIPEKPEFAFTDISVHPIVDIKEEMSYQYKRIDSALVRVPVKKEATTIKSFQELAWSAAKFIATLRENRFRLLVGLLETEKVPEKVNERVTELNKLEKNYVELFIGHTIYDTLVYNYIFEPEKQDFENVSSILCYFTENEGIKPSRGDDNPNLLYGTPISIKLTPAILPDVQKKEEMEKIEPLGLIYRIPAQAKAQVQLNGNTLLSQIIPVAQWGSYAYLPVELLYESKTIEFDINTGGLLKISE
jgi:hypothetical protein